MNVRSDDTTTMAKLAAVLTAEYRRALFDMICRMTRSFLA